MNVCCCCRAAAINNNNSNLSLLYLPPIYLLSVYPLLCKSRDDWLPDTAKRKKITMMAMPQAATSLAFKAPFPSEKPR